MNLFVGMAISEPFHYFSWVFIVVFSICVHEYAHAAAALQLGDDTAAQSGHLTLNPLVQMGGTSMIALLLVGIAWGAVPINPYLLGSRGRAWVALAGPFSNLMLSIVFASLAVVAMFAIPPDVVSKPLVLRFFEMGSVANAMLCLFNMFPIPLLDGWSVLAGFIPRMDRIDRTSASNFSFLLMGVLFMSPAGVLVWKGAERMSGFFVETCMRITGLG